MRISGDGAFQCSLFRLLFNIGSSTWLSAILLLFYLFQEGPTRSIFLSDRTTLNSNDEFKLKPHSWCSPNKKKKEEHSTTSKKESPTNILLFCSGSVDGLCAQIGHLLEELGTFYTQHKIRDSSWNTVDDLQNGTLNGSKRFEGRTLSKGKEPFKAIIFDSIQAYNNLSKGHKRAIHKYCQKHSTGILFMNTRNKEQLHLQMKSYTFRAHSQLRNLQIVESKVYSILQSPKILYETLDASNYVSISSSTPSSSSSLITTSSDNAGLVNIVIMDQVDPTYEFIIFACNPLNHWLTKLAFIDTLSHFSSLHYGTLDRYVLVDIDDIFVGKNRLLRQDVQHLLRSQRFIRDYFVENFKYNLGFSGANYQNSIYSIEQKDGDLALIESKDEFFWFPHMYRHLQPHLFNSTKELMNQMIRNKKFATKHGINTDNFYAVSPHHSGVYPLHIPLYEAWRKGVWNISVTSTEEYPHLKPARGRRGFIHDGIYILPRQTCGLFTKNIHYADYPRSPEVLEKSLYGGELPYTILSNPVNIFMTHMPNYGFDRLAPYVFESTFSFLKCWTNVRLKTVSPIKLAEIYFSIFPEEKTPVWGNPCSDPRHREIWSPNKSCNKFPDFIIIGPQKTGTTALHTFLKLHPSVQPNYQHPKTFEELQFFSNNAEYFKGVDHYSSFFDDKGDGQWNFEKSATYFDKEPAAKRASNLLPDAKIISLLISPSKRALSWYHHSKAHQDPVALNYSFYEVITANASSKAVMKGLQSRILEPGKYVQHLKSWLKYYRPNNLFVLNGEELRNDPIPLLRQLQVWLGLRPVIDYGKLLVYDGIKGFYCQRTAPGVRNKCLGKNKGREYPDMSPESKRFLKSYYREYNLQLKALLHSLDFSIPAWLMEELDLY